MTPVIIEAAINGMTPKSRNPHVPVTPDEIARDGIACIDAGAAIIHAHIENLRLTGTVAADRYAEGFRPILAARPEAVLCPTSGYDGPEEPATKHQEILGERGLARMGVLDPGSVNLASAGENGLPGTNRAVYANSFDAIEAILAALSRARLGPSIAIYEPGFLRATLAYHRAGRLPPGTMVKLYFGGGHDFQGRPGSVSFGLPPTAKALDAYLEMLESCDLPWAVAVLGGDVIESGLARLAVERGGHIRVGLEDYGGPRSPTNFEFVEAAVAIARAAGREIADGAMAARILKLLR